MPQPQVQSCVRARRTKARFLIGDNPEKSTPGSLVTVLHAGCASSSAAPSRENAAIFRPLAITCINLL